MERVQQIRQLIDRHPLKSRLFSAAISFPVVFGAIWLGSLWLSMMVALLAGIGTWELCRMARFAGKDPATSVAVGWSFTIVAFVQVMGGDISLDLVWVFFILLPVFAYFVWQIWRVRHKLSGLDWAITAGAPLYTGGMLAHGLLLRNLEEGMWWMMCTVLVTFVVDTMAYGGGRLIGKTRLAPTVSPGKTWEGAISGLAGGILCVLLFVTAFDSDIGFLQAIILGLLLGLAGQLGDLLESWLKRATGVKDSGWIIFGHGGVMDRLDSIVPNVAVMYYFVVLVVQ